jgi:ASC-1-like (ASCH) protein
LPLLRAKKEVFEWLREAKKTIDIRKGNPQRGEIAVFEAGPHVLRLKIVRKQSGILTDLVRSDNYRQVIPSAGTLEDAFDYLRRLYGDCDGVFTAYYVEKPKELPVNGGCGKF